MIIFIITRIFWIASLIIKEFGVFVGIVEQIIKFLAGIVSFTPSREDDELIQAVEDLFDSWQKKIYSGASIIVNFYNKVWKKIK
jgi:phage-related protein